MKKLMFFLAFSAMILGLAACGNDDEPQTTRDYDFYLDLTNNIGTIDIYDVVFTIGDRESPAMTIRIPDAKFTKDGNIITFNDTNIAPMMIRGENFIPMGDPTYNVTDLKCEVNVKKETFTISFNCHGGTFTDSGKIHKLTYIGQDGQL